MGKTKRIPPLPRPTRKVYQCFDLSFWIEERKDAVEPQPIEKTLAELLLHYEENSEEPLYILIRSNLNFDFTARWLRSATWADFGRISFPQSSGVVKRSSKPIYLCDTSGGDRKGEWTWYRVDCDNDRPTVRRINWEDDWPRPTTTEIDKVLPRSWFEFDGTFTDLLNTLEKQGFRVER